MRISLAEDHPFRAEADEDISADQSHDDECEWGDDPMDILMAKQERERNDLAFMLDSLVH